MSPGSENFGQVVIGTSAVQTFTATNTGCLNLVIGSLGITGTNPSDFSKSADNCSAKQIAPNGSCSVQATFVPSALGLRSATLGIPSNDPSTPTANVSLSGTGRYPQLTVTNAGTGTGTVTSSPSGISCGSVCTASYNVGTVLTMTAAPSPGSSFAGWSGGGCSGTGTTCTITLNVDTTVTATFNIIAPVANFSASPITGSVPLTVTFTDLSTYNPTSWLWNFGDGTTSSLQNPSHIYLSQGPYTVSLTATNGGGPNTKTVSNYITVQACPNLAILQGKTPGYSTLQDAYNAASNGDVIQSLGIEFTGTQINPDGSNTLKINLNKTVTLNGGYNCGFTTNSGNMTLLKGILETYSTGLPITVGNFDLVQQ